MTDLVNSAENGRRKEIIIPDASPLIYLAKMDLLHLLPAMYERILITDVVWMEATRGAEKFEDAKKIQKWGENLQEKMPNHFVIADTALGDGIKMRVQANPDYREKNAGENSIVQWANNASDDPRFRELHPDILYENGKVPNLVKLYDLPVTTLNTFAFLEDAEAAGHVLSLRKIFHALAEKEVHFKLERSVQYNEAALKELSAPKGSVKLPLENKVFSPWKEKDTQAFLERERKLAEYGNQWSGSSKKQKLLADTKDLTEKAKYHRSQDAELDKKLSQESWKIKKDMERGR